MKRLLLSALFFLIVGCTTVGDYQSKCELANNKFPEMVQCLKTSLSQDSRISGNDQVKLYTLKADQLVQMVNNNQISDIDARVVLQELYVKIKQQQNVDVDRILATMPRRTIIIR